MPPKKATRASSRSAAAAQGTLTFDKAAPNRITKSTSGVSPLSKSKKPQARIAAEIIAPPAAPDPLTAASDPVTTADVLGGRASPSPEPETEADAEVDPEAAADDAAARALPPSAITAYWRAKEQARLAPRVHQTGLGTGEKVLREWDMSGQFGPCVGIGREQRWRRARRLGLEPPVEVLAVLLKGEEEGRAHVDVLMGNGVAAGA